jgi:hypothetical protein
MHFEHIERQKYDRSYWIFYSIKNETLVSQRLGADLSDPGE